MLFLTGVYGKDVLVGKKEGRPTSELSINGGTNARDLGEEDSKGPDD